MGSTKWNYHKKRSFFRRRTSIESRFDVPTTKYSHYTSCKCWRFIWVCFFHVGILSKSLVSQYLIPFSFHWTSPIPANICLEEDILKTSFVFVFRRHLQYVFKTSLAKRKYSPWSYVFRRRIHSIWLYIFKTSWRCLQDALPKGLPHIFKMQYQDVWNTSSK